MLTVFLICQTFELPLKAVCDHKLDAMMDFQSFLSLLDLAHHHNHSWLPQVILIHACMVLVSDSDCVIAP